MTDNEAYYRDVAYERKGYARKRNWALIVLGTLWLVGWLYS